MSQHDKSVRDKAIEIEKRLTDQGKLIEGGWCAFRLLVLPKEAPNIQVDEMRKAFMAGAQHLFGSIMSIMDEDAEPTEKDMQRMSLIAKELDDYVTELKRASQGKVK